MKASFSPLSIQNRKELDNWLSSIPMFASAGKSAMNAYSLTQIKAFLAHIGNPQHDYFCIHVAGTNGKGSTVRILDSIYSKAGYKVGATISPHLIDYAERFTINGEVVDNQTLLSFFKEYGHIMLNYQLSFFEMATAFAFWWFSQQQVDLAIIECGLGGRLDATNVVDNKLAIITSIGFDHTDILGATLDKIATEKAGILREGMPVLVGDITDDAMQAIKKQQKLVGALWIEKSKSAVVNPLIENALGYYEVGQEKVVFKTNLFNPIQSKNIELAINAINLLGEKWPISFKEMQNGIESCVIPARFEPLFSHKKWYFDGFHNLESFENTRSLVNSMSKNPVYVLSFMTDKFTEEMEKEISQLTDLYMVKSNNPRALKPENFEANWIEISDLNNIYNKFPDSLVIVGGSFYFYSRVKEWSSSLL